MRLFRKRKMKVTFDKKYLQELYEDGKTSDKKYRFQPSIVKRYQARIKTLEQAACVEDLFTINSLRYHVLKGDKEGVSAISVNDQYRIEFKTLQAVSETTIVTICDILELSNHYE